MVTDVQGWKVEVGQYIVTDPIVFSYEKGQLGLVDYGKEGMIEWMEKHKEKSCNEVCNSLEFTK